MKAEALNVTLEALDALTERFIEKNANVVRDATKDEAAARTIRGLLRLAMLGGGFATLNLVRDGQLIVVADTPAIAETTTSDPARGFAA